MQHSFKTFIFKIIMVVLKNLSNKKTNKLKIILNKKHYLRKTNNKTKIKFCEIFILYKIYKNKIVQ